MNVCIRHKNGEIFNNAIDGEKIVGNFSTTHLRKIRTWEYSNGVFLRFIGQDSKIYYYKLDTVYNFVIELED